jgi:TatA/E family protein of Tat protein translocase
VLNLDPAKLLVIAVVAVILLGPDRLPQVARQVGAAWRSFAEFRHKMEADVRSSIPDLPSSADIARLARSPSALLDHLSNMDSASSVDTAATNGDASAASTSADGPRNESPVTGVPITPTDSPTPVPPTPVPPTPVPPTTRPPQPANPPDPSLN